VRIVSLLPAATEIVCALGLRSQLVGRSHECDYPRDVEALPTLTRARVDSSQGSDAIDAEVRRIVAERLPIYMLDEARLAALAPDVVVTQAACEVCAISYDQVVGSLKRTALASRVVSLQPARLGDLWSDIRSVAQACGVPARGEALVADLLARLDAVRASAQPPRVAVIEWLAPPMLAGHWVPEAIAAAGGTPVGPAAGNTSPYVTWEEIRALCPDAVVVAPCGFDLPRTLRESAPVAEELRSLTPRVLFMDGNAYLNRPGPRIVEAIETIAGWLRGETPPQERAMADLGVPLVSGAGSGTSGVFRAR
jgi:iron complex transport system substrate-binding protein